MLSTNGIRATDMQHEQTPFTYRTMELSYVAGERPWSVPSGDHFNFSDAGKSTDLEIIARRHGFEQLIISERNVKQSNANIAFISRTSDANLYGNHTTDFHDDHNHTFCYLCSVNPHERERTQPREEYKRRKLIPYHNPKARLSSSLDRIGQGLSADLVSYRFIVRTGTEKNSGTRAQVFLYMYGTEKNWSSIPLRKQMDTNSSASVDGFPSGSSRTFCLKGPDIGQLHHLNVNLVGARSDKEWFLNEIEVTNLKTSTTWLCEFNCWLPNSDEQAVNQITVQTPRTADSSLSVYILQIRTGENPLAGTDANIHASIRGSMGHTPRLLLTSNRANLFEQNQLDTFALVHQDLGDSLEIIVESDQRRLASDWDVKEMTMWKILPKDDDQQLPVYFPCNARLGKKTTTVTAKSELYPVTDLPLKGPICYHVMIQTGKAISAGTDANVFLMIYGRSGRTAAHRLTNRLKNDFERNSLSEFTIMDMDIGVIDRIKIWHDNSNPGSAWLLDSVVIEKKYSTCQTIADIYMQRLDRISEALYRQSGESRKGHRTASDGRSSQIKDDIDRRSSDRLGSSRGILRSLIMYDRASLQKKVTWDEQSIGSQDDLYSMDSQRTRSLQGVNEQKTKQQSGGVDAHVVWVSSHSYQDGLWKISSAEETESFGFDQSTRSLLLSDRQTANHRTKGDGQGQKDKVYEFQANRWLAKDKEDGQLEVYLTPKSSRKSSLVPDANMDTKNTRPTTGSRHFDIQHHKRDDPKKGAKRVPSSKSEPIEKPSRDLASRPSPISKTRLHNSEIPEESSYPSTTRPTTSLKPKTESLRPNPLESRLPPSSPLKPRSKPSSGVHHLSNLLSDEPPTRPRSSIASLSPLSQPAKSPRNTDEQRLSNEISRAPLTHLRSSATSLLSTDQSPKSTRVSNDRLTRVPDDPLSYSRSAPMLMSSSNSRLKSSWDMNDHTDLTNTKQDLLEKLTDEPPHRLRSSLASLSSLNQREKPHRRADKQEPAPGIADGLPSYSQSTFPAKPGTSPRLTSLHNSHNHSTTLINTRDLHDKTLPERANHSRSTLASMKSPYSHSEFNTPTVDEDEGATRMTAEPSLRSRPSTTSLSPLSQRAKLTRRPDDSLDPLMQERETLAKLPPQPSSHLRSSSSLLNSSRLSKQVRSNDVLTSASINTAPESPWRPKSAARTRPSLTSQRAIFDPEYGTAAPSNDF